MNNLTEKLFKRIGEEWLEMETGYFLGFLKPKITQALGIDKLEAILSSGKKLRIKYGVDPTGNELHVGHIVPMMLLEIFQKAGHPIDFIVGDFTAMIGDPAGRDSARVVLTEKQITENMRDYAKQAGRFVSIKKMAVHYNSTWLENIKIGGFFSHLQNINATAAMQRDDFRKRAERGQTVSMAELLYGVLMGLDSIELKSDIEVSGLDQFLNVAQVRMLMGNAGMTPEIGLFTPIIEGTDGSGAKMSKSLGNTISVLAPLDEKFGKVMSIPDYLIIPWFKAFTFIHEDELTELETFVKENPMEAKKTLGMLLIALETKSLSEGEEEKQKFEKTFSHKIITEEDCEDVSAEANIFLSLLPKFSSKSELHRLFEQKAVRTNNEKILSETDSVTGIIRVGKRKFFNVK